MEACDHALDPRPSTATNGARVAGMQKTRGFAGYPRRALSR